MSMEKTVDRDLVVRARAGNRDAFGSLIDRYQVVAKSIALRMIANEDIAREMVQEAVLQALLSLHRLRDDGRFKNWFFGIVINVCRVYLRQQESGYLSLESLEALDSWPVLSHDGDRSTDPQDLVEARELHGLMLSAIEDLSAANRDAVILFYYRHLSLQEIAEALDVTTGSVKVRLHRARKQLRDQLLKIYPEIDLYISADQRSKTMIPVRIADLVRLGGRNIVLLLDDTGQRVLPIWIGEFEAISIAIGLRGLKIPRPLTHKFFANVIETLGAELVEARVEALKEDTFYGVAKLRNGDRTQEIDARPSDILALAAQTGCLIYVGEEVMERAGMDIEHKDEAISHLGAGVDVLIDEVNEVWRRAQSEMDEATRDRCHQELIEYISGGLK